MMTPRKNNYHYDQNPNQIRQTSIKTQNELVLQSIQNQNIPTLRSRLNERRKYEQQKPSLDLSLNPQFFNEYAFDNSQSSMTTPIAQERFTVNQRKVHQQGATNLLNQINNISINQGNINELHKESNNSTQLKISNQKIDVQPLDEDNLINRRFKLRRESKAETSRALNIILPISDQNMREQTKIQYQSDLKIMNLNLLKQSPIKDQSDISKFSTSIYQRRGSIVFPNYLKRVSGTISEFNNSPRNNDNNSSNYSKQSTLRTPNLNEISKIMKRDIQEKNFKFKNEIRLNNFARYIQKMWRGFQGRQLFKQLIQQDAEKFNRNKVDELLQELQINLNNRVTLFEQEQKFQEEAKRSVANRTKKSNINLVLNLSEDFMMSQEKQFNQELRSSGSNPKIFFPIQSESPPISQIGEKFSSMTIQQETLGLSTVTNKISTNTLSPTIPNRQNHLPIISSTFKKQHEYGGRQKSSKNQNVCNLELNMQEIRRSTYNMKKVSSSKVFSGSLTPRANQAKLIKRASKKEKRQQLHQMFDQKKLNRSGELEKIKNKDWNKKEENNYLLSIFFKVDVKKKENPFLYKSIDSAKLELKNQYRKIIKRKFNKAAKDEHFPIESAQQLKRRFGYLNASRIPKTHFTYMAHQESQMNESRETELNKEDSFDNYLLESIDDEQSSQGKENKVNYKFRRDVIRGKDQTPKYSDTSSYNDSASAYSNYMSC
eukprot:403348574